jgi:hypothetical protein
MDTDRNLLFGVLALQLDLIGAQQFAEICTAWTARKGTPLAELLVERGWLAPADRADVERLLARKLARHGGDPQASLARPPGARVSKDLPSAEKVSWINRSSPVCKSRRFFPLAVSHTRTTPPREAATSVPSAERAA